MVREKKINCQIVVWLLSNVAHTFHSEEISSFSKILVCSTFFQWVCHRSPLFGQFLSGCILKEKVLTELARSSPDVHMWRGWLGLNWDSSTCNKALAIIVWRRKTVFHIITHGKNLIFAYFWVRETVETQKDWTHCQYQDWRYDSLLVSLINPIWCTFGDQRTLEVEIEGF